MLYILVFLFSFLCQCGLELQSGEKPGSSEMVPVSGPCGLWLAPLRWARTGTLVGRVHYTPAQWAPGSFSQQAGLGQDFLTPLGTIKPPSATHQKRRGPFSASPWKAWRNPNPDYAGLINGWPRVGPEELYLQLGKCHCLLLNLAILDQLICCKFYFY